MSDYASVSHCTRNDRGLEEITIEKNRTLFQLLFRRPATTVTYELFFGDWMNYGTGKKASYDEQVEISRLRHELQYIGVRNR